MKLRGSLNRLNRSPEVGEIAWTQNVELRLDQLVDHVAEHMVKRCSVLKGNGPNKVLRFPRASKELARS